MANMKIDMALNYNQIEKISSDQIVSEKTLQMTSSIASILDDSTPSDSGIQLLDSESTELNESMISSAVFDADITNEIKNNFNNEESLENLKAQSDILNSNTMENTDNPIPAEMTSSTCSTFDTENIVYRRRIKKPNNKAPKKRVSFHEDILKNTKTDNIHIEHGFITYKNGANKKVMQKSRYSWCSEYDNKKDNSNDYDYDYDNANDNRQYVYRNACSDVLDYGKTDVFENMEDEKNYVKYDNSGVFEYGPNDRKLYKCGCSDSNSSLESGESNDAIQNYKQTKSNSCECIGMTDNCKNNNNIISDNCYYSEPNIGRLDEFNGNNVAKSVWSKEKKPKSSCLKKTKKDTIYTNIVPEYDLNKKVKKFNVHHLSVIDNSKMIIGSLKDIFGISLPERGVPEGSEDLTSVKECIPETSENIEDDFTVVQKPRPFLSKSLDNGFAKATGGPSKKYVHNVDTHLRRKNDEDLYAPTRKNSVENEDEEDDENENIISTPQVTGSTTYRNKYIINNESTVFEHTGVSYCYEETEKYAEPKTDGKDIPVAETMTSSFIAKKQIKDKLSSIFKTITNTSSQPVRSVGDGIEGSSQEDKVQTSDSAKTSPKKLVANSVMESSITSSISESEQSVSVKDYSTTKTFGSISPRNQNKNRHLNSPMRKKSLTTRMDRARMSPDLFNIGGKHLNSEFLQAKSILSEEFDDILTITTTSETDKTMDSSSDIVVLDYPAVEEMKVTNESQFLKPPNIMTTSSSSSSSSKTSLINRFLRNVTQKKIMEATIQKNKFFATTKLNSEKKLCGNLYVKGAKPIKKELIADLNAEIAMEIEMSSSSKQLEKVQIKESPGLNIDINISGIDRNFMSLFGVGVGEISIELFQNKLHILRNDNEVLMKAFKLFNGYSREGYMTPVLVFLTDKTLYVTDNVRNRLCNKFVLPYSELDVILVGPHGNTVLLSNSARDMQQVLLAGGPYPADGLVSSLELCARRGGSILPAVGQLTLDHLTPLQAFVRDNSCVNPDDKWKYYAIVNVPASTLGAGEQEPLGPHIKGPLMHRRLSHSGIVDNWEAGYCLLKAGVLYLFNDSTQKIPYWAVALTECQGARRSINSNRPYCFELLLRTGSLQLAAPDEYVASDWLQALVQAASGTKSLQLFEMQDRHKTLGCTLIMTTNHLLTVREDFSSPLRRVATNNLGIVMSPSKENINPNTMRKMSNSTILDTSSDISSTASSTPTKMNDRRTNSTISTPTKMSSLSQRNVMINPPNSNEEKSYTNMTSFYGKNSGVEVLACASIDEMNAVRISAQPFNYWCILEFECQEVRENSDDLVIFFTTGAEQERFLNMLESIWLAKMATPFPVNIVMADDPVHDHCSKLFSDLNRSWEPLLSAALGRPH